jgi:hypothetical protein
MNSGSILVIALLVGSDDDSRDTVTLQDGKQIAGRVLLETADKVLLSRNTRETWYARDQVKGIESVSRSHGEFLERFAALPSETVPSLLPLAEFCREKELLHEETLLYWRILALDPDHATANERLGHKRGRQDWMAALAGRAIPVRKLDEARKDWGKAWELRSEHFKVRCAGGLRKTLDTLFELEFLYRAFVDLYQGPLAFREMIEPFSVLVYPRREDYPSAGTHVGAYFDPGENAVYSYLAGGRPYALFHESTHGLLYNLFVRSSKSKGGFPPWLDEAWADHMQTVLVPTPDRPGRPRLEPGRKNLGYLSLVARERDPYGLPRVLNFGTSDFPSSSDQGLKYAQGYALFHYLMHGSEEHRARFLDYVRDAANGQGQSSTFNNAFGPVLREVERRYIEYAVSQTTRSEGKGRGGARRP